MTPRQILWQLPLADGRQYCAAWWALYSETTKGVGLRQDAGRDIESRDYLTG